MLAAIEVASDLITANARVLLRLNEIRRDQKEGWRSVAAEISGGRVPEKTLIVDAMDKLIESLGSPPEEIVNLAKDLTESFDSDARAAAKSALIDIDLHSGESSDRG